MRQKQLSSGVPALFNDELLPSFLRHFSLIDDDSFSSKGWQENSNLSLSEDENKVYIEAHLPGVSEDDIEITLNKGTIWIKGSANQVEEDEKRKYYYKANRSFSYRIAVPGNIDESKEPVAGYENGVLTITFNKQEREVPRRIQVQKK